MSIFILDTNRKPQNPVHPVKARLLLAEGKAAVFRQFPFTIILKEKVLDVESNPLRIKIDPGSRDTGIAVIKDDTGELFLPWNWDIEANRSKTIWNREEQSEDPGETGKRDTGNRALRTGPAGRMAATFIKKSGSQYRNLGQTESAI